MITYKILKSAELEDIVALYKDAGWWEEGDLARAVIPKMITGSFCFIGAFDNTKMVGMGRAISDGCSDAYIQDVVVLKEYRGKKIGAEIIKALTEFCLKNNLVWIGLISEPGVEHFYQGLNFKPMLNYVPMKYSESAE